MGTRSVKRSWADIVPNRCGGKVEAIDIVLLAAQFDVVGEPVSRLISRFVRTDNVSIDHGDGELLVLIVE